MNHSEQIDKIAMALSKAQGKIKQPARDKVALVKMKAGGDYSFHYIDLASVIEAIREPFAENGLCYVQGAELEVAGERAWMEVTTIIVHESGQWFKSTLRMPVGDDRPQTIGSAETYARRYALCAMAGIAPAEDDNEPEKYAQMSQDRSPAPTPQTQDAGTRFDENIPMHKKTLAEVCRKLDINSVSVMGQVARWATQAEDVYLGDLSNAVAWWNRETQGGKVPLKRKTEEDRA